MIALSFQSALYIFPGAASDIGTAILHAASPFFFPNMITSDIRKYSSYYCDFIIRAVGQGILP